MSQDDIEQFEPQYEPDDDYGRELESKRQQVGHHIWLPGGKNSDIAWGKEGPSADSVLRLTPQHLAELTTASRLFDESGLSLTYITKENFPLPSLAQELAFRRRTLHRGDGFFKLEGLNPGRSSSRENVIIFAGLAKHLAASFARQGGGKFLVHMTDLTASAFAGQRLPAPYVRSDLPPHTDNSADVIAMYVIQSPHRGGRGTFCSIRAVCEDLANVKPDALATLQAADWPFDRPRQPQGLALRPLLYLTESGPQMFFSRGALVKSARNNRDPNLPKLTRQQSKALDAVHFSAVANTFYEPWMTGTMVFFNNRRILHGREGFEDVDVGDEQSLPPRYILRMFLSDPELAGPLPAPLKLMFDIDNAVACQSEDQDWPAQPQPD